MAHGTWCQGFSVVREHQALGAWFQYSVSGACLLRTQCKTRQIVKQPVLAWIVVHIVSKRFEKALIGLLGDPLAFFSSSWLPFLRLSVSILAPQGTMSAPWGHHGGPCESRKEVDLHFIPASISQFFSEASGAVCQSFAALEAGLKFTAFA